MLSTINDWAVILKSIFGQDISYVVLLINVAAGDTDYALRAAQLIRNDFQMF